MNQRGQVRQTYCVVMALTQYPHRPNLTLAFAPEASKLEDTSTASVKTEMVLMTGTESEIRRRSTKATRRRKGVSMANMVAGYNEHALGGWRGMVYKRELDEK